MVKSIPFCLLCIFFITCVANAEESSVGFFKSSNGLVQILRADSTFGVIPGDPVMTSDTIITGSGVTAGVVFRDGTVLTLGEETEMEVRRYVFDPGEQQYEFSLYMKKGEVLYSSGKLGKLAPGEVNLQTPRATVGIRGTRFILSAK